MSHITHPTWRKSSFSANGSNCVEVADAGHAILLRDSKHPEQGHLTFTATEMSAFIDSIKAGELDNLL